MPVRIDVKLLAGTPCMLFPQRSLNNTLGNSIHTGKYITARSICQILRSAAGDRDKVIVYKQQS